MAISLRRKLRQISLDRVYSAEENARLILNERTQQLASRLAGDAPPARPATSVLICGSGRERYGIPVADIAEILPAQTCVPIPDGPPALVGVLGRGGRLVSVIDLGTALGTSASAPASEPAFEHFVLLRRQHPRVALRVERAHGVTTATPIAAEEAQTFRNDAVVGYAEAQAGFGDQDGILSLLDVDRLIQPFLSSFPVSGV